MSGVRIAAPVSDSERRQVQEEIAEVPAGARRRRPKPRHRDPLESALEAALQPGRFIGWRSGGEFVSNLETVSRQLARLVRTRPGRAVRLYETFLAGCYEKAEELDDSGGDFGAFVVDLYRGWIKARQAAKSSAEETASLLLERIENDPYGFASSLERDAVKVMDKHALAAFERAVRTRFDAKDSTVERSDQELRGHLAGAHPRSGRILRAIYIRQRNVRAYVALCEQTQLSAQDCLAIATLLRRRRQPAEALAWVDRGLAIEKKHPHGSMAGHDLAKLERDLLVRLGRRHDALLEVWAAFCDAPNTFSYEELMRFVPRAERTAWRTKAMDAVEHATLGSLIDLWLKTRQVDRLAARLRTATEAEIEGLSHYQTEPAARRLEKPHPDVAAKVYRALGLRILNARKNKYYDAALSHFTNARRSYERAGIHREWVALIADVRRAHHRKSRFMADFDRLAAGQRPRASPSFLERARSHWPVPGKSFTQTARRAMRERLRARLRALSRRKR